MTSRSLLGTPIPVRQRATTWTGSQSCRFAFVAGGVNHPPCTFRAWNAKLGGFGRRAALNQAESGRFVPRPRQVLTHEFALCRLTGVIAWASCQEELFPKLALPYSLISRFLPEHPRCVAAFSGYLYPLSSSHDLQVEVLGPFASKSSLPLLALPAKPLGNPLRRAAAVSSAWVRAGQAGAGRLSICVSRSRVLNLKSSRPQTTE